MGAPMTTDRYQPVSCDYHDMLEAAAMHRRKVELEFELEGVPQKEEGTIADVYTRGGGGVCEVRGSQRSGGDPPRSDHLDERGVRRTV